MRPQTLAVAADASFEKYRKPTRREIFLEMAYHGSISPTSCAQGTIR
jgi:hypothetical protein